MKATELHKNWYCPNCGLIHQSIGKETAMHHCPSLHNLFIPLVLEGTKVNNKINLREDYLHGDLASARTDTGSVVSSVTHETDEGIGATIYVPTATFDIRRD